MSANQIKLKAKFEQVVVKAFTPTKLVLVLVDPKNVTGYTEDYVNCLKAVESEDLNVYLRPLNGSLFDDVSEYDRGYTAGWDAAMDSARGLAREIQTLKSGLKDNGVTATLEYKGKTVDMTSGEVLSDQPKDTQELLGTVVEDAIAEIVESVQPSARECPTCNGSGVSLIHPEAICDTCHGSGELPGEAPEPPAEAEASESQAEGQETTEWLLLSPEHIGSVLVRQGMSAEESPWLILTGCTPSCALIAVNDEGAERFIDESSYNQFWMLLQEEPAPIPFSEKLEAGDRIRSKRGAEIVGGRPSRALVIKVLANAVQTDKGLVPKKVIDEKYELDVDGAEADSALIGRQFVDSEAGTGEVLTVKAVKGGHATLVSADGKFTLGVAIEGFEARFTEVGQ